MKFIVKLHITATGAVVAFCCFSVCADELPQPGENVAYNNQHLPPQEIDPNQGLMHLNQGVGDQDKPQQVMGLPPKHPFGQQIPAGQGFPPNPYNQGLEQQRARIQGSVFCIPI